MAIYYIFIAIFGVMIGSFLSVCVYRIPRECMSIIKPGSHCTICGNHIKWYHNMPILSYLLLHGKCAYCGEKYSPKYLLIEIVTMSLFLLAGFVILPERGIPTGMHIVNLIFFCILLAGLIAASFIDFEFQIIPHEITFFCALLGLIGTTIFPFLARTPPINLQNPNLTGMVASLAGIISGMAAIYIIRFLGSMAFRKEAMGLGDMFFMGMIGAFIGWRDVLLVIFIACMVGSIFGIFIWAIKKSNVMPFGPYLSIGAITMLLFSKHVYRFILYDYPKFLEKLF